MVKYTLTYLAGGLTIAGAAIAAGGHGSVVAFGAGAFFTVVAIAAAIGSTCRLRRVAHFLNALAYAIDKKPEQLRAKLEVVNKEKPAEAETLDADPESVAGMVYTGLLNLKVSKKMAKAATEEALRITKPAAGEFGPDFGELFQTALSITRRAA